MMMTKHWLLEMTKQARVPNPESKEARHDIRSFFFRRPPTTSTKPTTGTGGGYV